ncbi:Nitrilase family, member 2 [Seminavis robusta]|uniref:Nitrilase family, member 2 n=1 Tax=Seminavis robusta TaxID=568900 RepID=A0A9N8E2X8_9STRA|nr:Nitrilase family, member 2 [Seminavis robusta]|eukprot:Sro596_g172900.1 Nitrilase family, member 2 (309) ;mRNA; f:53484-54410
MNSELFEMFCASQLPIQSFASGISDDKMVHDNTSTSSTATATTTATASSSNSQPKRRTNVPKCIDKTKILLPIDFEPSEHSIICGNKRKYFNSPGNMKLRVLVKSFIPQYSKADGKLEKGYIVSKVMNMIRDACPVGAFIAMEKGRWWQVSERTSREKVGSYFRDCLSNKYASSAKNKIARRKTKREETKKQPMEATTMPEPVASLPPIQFTGLQALQMSGNLSNFPLATSSAISSLPRIQQLASLPNFMTQQLQQQNHFQFPSMQQITQQQQQQLNFVIDEEDSSISSGSASFYDVDDLAPVPLLEL